jgi:hypothetical protein
MRRLRPVATISDLTKTVEQLEETLSQVLVLLYFVVDAHQTLVERMGGEEASPSARVLALVSDLKDRRAHGA